MSRIAERADFEPPVRIRLLERDMDQHDEMIERLNATLEGMRKVLLGMLISLATAAVLLAVNLAVLSG